MGDKRGGWRSECGFWVIRWKRLWSVTFKRWTTLQGTSARTHGDTKTHTHAETTVCSYLLMSRQAGRRREQTNGRALREWNKYLPVRQQPPLSLKKVVCKRRCENTSILLNDTQTHADNNYSSVLLSVHPDSPCLYLRFLHPLIKIVFVRVENKLHQSVLSLTKDSRSENGVCLCVCQLN